MSPETRDLILVVVSILAGVQYVINFSSLLRNRRVENVTRFMQIHQQLFHPDGYIMLNVENWEKGQVQRDMSNAEMERKFHTMLLDIERVAVLANNKAAPPKLQVYMLGWYALRIVNLISEKERNDVFWELALDYLNDLVRRAKDYSALDSDGRARYLKHA